MRADTLPGLDLADYRRFIETGRMQQAKNGESDLQRTAFKNRSGIHVHVRSLGGTKCEYVQSDGTVLAERRIRWQKNPLYPNPESARELCGLLPLRGWRNAKVQQILPGGA